MNVRAIFGARPTPSLIHAHSRVRIVASWAVRQRRAYMTVGGGQTFHVRAPLVLIEVEEIEPGRGVLVVENPTEDMQPVWVTVVGVAISDPLSDAERQDVVLIEKWLKEARA